MAAQIPLPIHPRRNQIVAVHRICQVVLGSLLALYLAPCKFRLGLFLVGNRLSGPFFVIKMHRNCRHLDENALATGKDLCNKNSSKYGFPEMCDGKGGEPRMGKRIVSLSAIALFAFTLTFAGCGKKEDPAPPPPPPPAPAPAAPAPSEPAAPSGEMKAPADQPSGGAPMEKKDEGTKTK